MVRGRKKSFLFGLEVLAISFFIWHRLIFRPGSAAERPFLFSLAVLALIWLLLSLALSWVLKAVASFLASRTQTDRSELGKSLVLTLAPFLLLGLTFLQHFLTLNDIDPTLLALACFGFAYLQLVFLTKLNRVRRQAITAGQRESHLTLEDKSVRPLSRRLFLLTLLAYIVYLSGLIFPALPLTGDEPHYLLITKSLLADGDINLSDNYRDKDYLEFYPGDLDLHAYPKKKGESFLYSRHLPALSVLVAPFYFIGEKLGPLVSGPGRNPTLERMVLIFFARLPVCLLAALLSRAVFLFVWELSRRKKAAILSWLVFSFTPPVLFYSHLIYPEIPVALILIWVSLLLIQKKDFSVRSLCFAGLGVALLPWFGIKYIVPAAAISLIIIFLLLNSPHRNLKRAFVFAGPLLFSAVLFLAFLFRIYGNLSPQTVYFGSAQGEKILLSHFIVSDFFGVLTRLLGYLFDQRVGLFIIAPVYVLFLPGLFLLAQKARKETFILAGLFSAFWAFCSLSYFYWGGYCPPGRPLLPVLWIPALFMAGTFTPNLHRAALAARDVIAALSFFITAVFIQNPGLLFLESLDNPGATIALGTDSLFLTKFRTVIIDWTTSVPALSSPVKENINWGPLLFWIPLVLGIAVFFLASKKPQLPESPLRSLRSRLTGWALLSVILVGNASLKFGPEKELILRGQGYEVVAQDQNSFSMELGGFWVRGKSRADLIIKTAEPVARFRLFLSSPVEGKTKVRLAGKTREVRRTVGSGLEQMIEFASPRSFRWRGSHLYRLEVKEEAGFYPSRIEPGSRDGRFLGVFIKVEPSGF